MARFLFTWELGQGLGHVNRLRPLAGELVLRGHEVFLAARDLARVHSAFHDSNVTLLPAPGSTRKRLVEQVLTYADLLLNVGFGDQGGLFGSIEAWRNLFALVKPDLLVCDHSPLALMAGQMIGIPRATVGTGFCCPIDESPLRMLREADENQQMPARSREQQLLHSINTVMKQYSRTAFERVTEVYSGARHFLMTFRELDHFNDRGDADYRGAWPYDLGGEEFVRPGDGPCVFAYLKPFPTLVEFLSHLLNRNINVVIYVDGWRPPPNLGYNGLQIARNPINVRQAAEQCDVAVTNGTHGTGVAMLLAGKPLVQIPLFLEQALFAEATARLGASITCASRDASHIASSVERAISETAVRQAAGNFANHYVPRSLSQLNRYLVDEFLQLII